MRFGVAIVALLALAQSTLAVPQQRRQFETPTAPEEKPHVAILKQINKINNDGSYTYGFEAADGSFRVETRDIHGNVKGKYGYVDEFGQTKTVEYEAGKPQGFMPQGQHLPVIPRPSSSGGNVDDEFGTDEDWQSVDADQDGHPDPPRPKDQRNTPIVQSVRPSPTPTFISSAPPQSDRPAPQVFIPAEFSSQQSNRPRQPIFIPASAIPQEQFDRPGPPPTFIPAGTQSFRPSQQPTFIPVQSVRQQPQQPQRQRDQQFSGPIFPFQLASAPANRAQQPIFGNFAPVPFSFQPRLQRQQQRE